MSASVEERAPLQTEEARQRLRSIPAFPGAARKLMSMVSSDAVNLREISEVLKSDAVLSGETLRMANSALFALRNEVTSVLHAVSVLGLERLKGVVLTVGLRNVMRSRTAASQRCWRHNLATALVAEQAAGAAGVHRASAYTAGLLHGVGFVALSSCCPDQWDHALADFAAGRGSLTEMERQQMGLTHVEAAQHLIEYWELPASFRETSRCDHSISAPLAEGNLAQLTNLACEAANWLGFAPWDLEPDWDPARFALYLPNTAKSPGTLEALPELVPYKINDFELSFLR